MISRSKGPVIVIAAGGTGGHIFPAIATGRELQELRPDATIIYACGERPLEIDLYKRNGIDPVVFPARQIRRGIVGKVGGILAAAGNVWRARRWVKSVGADLVVGFGGYVAGPTVLGAKFAGCRTAIHEANSIPGRTNRILGRMMDLTATHFESTLAHLGGKRKIALGMPLRRMNFDEERWQGRLAGEKPASDTLGAPAKPISLLVMGGSQGAKFLYESIMRQLPALDARLTQPLEILWSTGEANFEELQSCVESLDLNSIKVQLTPFISDMANALGNADVALARAGASALAELIAFRVYTVFVPFPGAIYDHQTLNAREAEKFGLGVVLPESEVGEKFIPTLASAIEHIQTSEVPTPPDSLDSTQAATRLAKELLSLVK